MSRGPARTGMAPPLPGAFIREEILDEFGLTVSEAARVLEVRRATLSDLINGNAGLLGGNGAADREGVRRQDGNAVEHAGMARRLRNAPKGQRDRGQALPVPRPRAALTGMCREGCDGVMKPAERPPAAAPSARPRFRGSHVTLRMRRLSSSALSTCVTILLALMIFLVGNSQMPMAHPTPHYIRKSSGADTVIVFVHGIMGDGVSTWDQ